jgi:glycine/D-amino acid oxidase-like deaminating enzyme
VSPADGAGGRHRVVIVGAGFGGLFAARFLRRAPVAVLISWLLGFVGHSRGERAITREKFG